MTMQEFHKLCSDHDWYYSYSDDRRRWMSGRIKAAALLTAVKAQPELTPHYNEWVAWIDNPDAAKQAPVSPE